MKPEKMLADCTGIRFGKLIAKEMVRVVGQDAKVRCICDCGKEKVVIMYNLKNGNTTSCGCVARELAASRGRATAPIIGASNATHGQSKTSTYASWCDAKKRCYNPANKRYSDYGARGIGMCDAWRNSYEEFLRDMGEKPHGFTLERKDVNLGYEPSNCIWANKTTQARNTRSNVSTMEIAREIRQKRTSGVSIKQLASDYGMSTGNIQQIIYNKTWQEVA